MHNEKDWLTINMHVPHSSLHTRLPFSTLEDFSALRTFGLSPFIMHAGIAIRPADFGAPPPQKKKKKNNKMTDSFAV